MPNLTLQLFGIPALSHPDGAPAPTTGAVKNLALLAFLTLEPGPHTREEIATLLWGDSTDEQARTSLRQALTRLKSVVGEGLTVTRQTTMVPSATSSQSCAMSIAWRAGTATGALPTGD